MPKVASRKFVSPAFSGEKVSDEKDTSKEIFTKNKATPCSLSDTQYEEMFHQVIKSSLYTDKRNTFIDDDGGKEGNVAIPEPNAALSPDEEAEGVSDDVVTHGSKPVATTPDNPTDNSILPQIKRKKPESRIKKLGLKLKPTRLNFDDPNHIGKPKNVPKPLETDTLPKSKSKIPKMPKNSIHSGSVENKENSLMAKETLKNKPKPSKAKGGDEGSFIHSVKPLKTPKFQSQRAVTGKGVEQEKKMNSSHDKIISSQQSVSNVGGLSLSQATPKSSHFGSQDSCSPESKILSPKSRLIRLQKKRNTGLWVQCSKDNCSKWRYLSTTCDPTEVPDNWQCYMNDDKRYSSCSVPEKGPTPLEEEDLIHNIYTAGSLVWARLTGYPWWPAIVDDDPDVEQYYWINEFCDIPTHYNVAFFDEKPVTRAWLTPSNLTKYIIPEKKRDLHKMTANGIDYSHRIKVAISQANEALKCPISERLKNFSFVARYKGVIGKKRQILDSPDTLKSKRAKREEKKKERSGSQNDSQANILRSLEVVKEVNQVLSQLTGDSDSEGSEEDPQADLNKSLEVVNEMLNEMSDNDLEGVDDEELENYLKSVAEKDSSEKNRAERKVISKAKKGFTKPAVRPDHSKGSNESKYKKLKTHSIKEAESRKPGMEHSSGLKESKKSKEGSDTSESAMRKEKLKKRSDQYKDKELKLHSTKDVGKGKPEMRHSSSLKESKQNKEGSNKNESIRKEKLNKGHDGPKDKKEKLHGIKEAGKDKSEMRHSSSLKESKQNKEGSDVSESEGVMRKKKLKKQSDESKDKEGKMHGIKDAMKRKPETGHSPSFKESKQNKEGPDINESEALKRKEKLNKERKDSEPKKMNEELVSKHSKGTSDSKQKKSDPGSKKKDKESGSKQNKEHSDKIEKATIKKKDEREKEHKKSGQINDKQKEGERTKEKRNAGAKNIPEENPMEDMKKLLKEDVEEQEASQGCRHVDEEDGDSEKDADVGDIDSDQETIIEGNVTDGEATGERESRIEVEESEGMEDEKEEEIEDEKEIDDEEEMEIEKYSEEKENKGGEEVEERDEEQVKEGPCSSTPNPSDGRSSIDLFKNGNEQDGASVASEQSADFDFEE